MALPRAAGMPDHAGKQIPELWPLFYIDRYYDSTVHKVMSQTDLQEGSEITSYGDTVHMQNIPVLNPKPYTVGMEIEFEYVDSPITSLTVDKGDYLAFTMNDVDRKQWKNKDYREKAIDNAVQEMRLSIERRFLADAAVTAAPENKGNTAAIRSKNVKLGATGAPVFVAPDQLSGTPDGTSAKPYNMVSWLLDVKRVLDEQNVPQVDRYAILPDIGGTILMDGPLKQVQFSGDQQSMVRKGYIGTVAGFDIYLSHLLPVSGSGATAIHTCMFGIPYAFSFVTQLVKAENLRLERGFDDAHKRLQVYGYKNKKPEAFVTSLTTFKRYA